MRLAASIAFAHLLVACSGGEDQPGAVTADDAQQLNEAAAMLDSDSVRLSAVAANHQDTP